jgi:hypothetical protein
MIRTEVTNIYLRPPIETGNVNDKPVAGRGDDVQSSAGTRGKPSDDDAALSIMRRADPPPLVRHLVGTSR